MQKIICIVGLMLQFSHLTAQLVMEARWEERKEEFDGEDELKNYAMKDVNNVKEISIFRENEDAITIITYSKWVDSLNSSVSWIDSSKTDTETQIYRLWRGDIVLIEGMVNAEQRGETLEGGTRKGIWTFKHDNGQIFATGEYDNYGNKIGEWLYYYPENQVLKKIEHYLLLDTSIIWDIDSNQVWSIRESRIDKDYVEYYSDGQIKVKGKYKTDLVLQDSAYLISYQDFSEISGPSLERYTKGYVFKTQKTGRWSYYDDKGILIKQEDFD